MNIRIVQAIGITGGLLILGLFAPLVSTPIVTSMNLISSESDKLHAAIFAILAILSWVLILTARFEGLFLTGLASLALLGVEFWSFQQRVTTIRNGVINALGSNALAGIEDISLNLVQIRWGWTVLGVGGLLLLLTALIREEALVLSKLVECPLCGEPIRESADICRFCRADLAALDEEIVAHESSHEGQMVEKDNL